MYSPESFFLASAVLSTMSNSRNLLIKQFSRELCIKQQLCTHTLRHLLFFYMCHCIATKCTFFLLSLGFGGSLVFLQHSPCSNLGLAMCLKHMLHLSLHPIFSSHTNCCPGSSVQTTSFLLSTFFPQLPSHIPKPMCPVGSFIAFKSTVCCKKHYTFLKFSAEAHWSFKGTGGHLQLCKFNLSSQAGGMRRRGKDIGTAWTSK